MLRRRELPRFLHRIAKRRARGFTLIELLVVIAIIAILAQVLRQFFPFQQVVRSFAKRSYQQNVSIIYTEASGGNGGITTSSQGCDLTVAHALCAQHKAMLRDSSANGALANALIYVDPNDDGVITKTEILNITGVGEPGNDSKTYAEISQTIATESYSVDLLREIIQDPALSIPHGPRQALVAHMNQPNWNGYHQLVDALARTKKISLRLGCELHIAAWLIEL